MRWLRYWQGDTLRMAVMEAGQDYVRPVSGDPFGEHRVGDERVPLAGLRLGPPVASSKIVAVALNYRSHLSDWDAPGSPELFLKPPSALAGEGDVIVLPAGSSRVDYEGEVVVVIGRRLRHATEAEAVRAIFGYTCGNDVSARDWQNGDKQWWRAKGADTFAPIGPWIETDLTPGDISLRTLVDGEERQAATTAQLIHSIPEVLAFASAVMTLEPGDIVFTGTPGTTQPLLPGQTVEVEVGGVGRLRNSVVAERAG